MMGKHAALRWLVAKVSCRHKMTKMECMTAQTSTLVFAVFNIILVTLSTAGCVGFSIFCIVTTFSSQLFGYQTIEGLILVLAFIMGWLSVSLLSLVFSSFLLNGIIKKNPHHMKAYFVFGVVMMVISVLAFLLITFTLELPMDIIIATVVVFACPEAAVLSLSQQEKLLDCLSCSFGLLLSMYGQITQDVEIAPHCRIICATNCGGRGCKLSRSPEV